MTWSREFMPLPPSLAREHPHLHAQLQCSQIMCGAQCREEEEQDLRGRLDPPALLDQRALPGRPDLLARQGRPVQQAQGGGALNSLVTATTTVISVNPGICTPYGRANVIFSTTGTVTFIQAGTDTSGITYLACLNGSPPTRVDVLRNWNERR